jgi:hypothetical protein
MRSPFLPLLAAAAAALLAVAALAWWLSPSEPVSSLPEEVVVGESSGTDPSGPDDLRPSSTGPGEDVVPVPPPVSGTPSPEATGPDAGTGGTTGPPPAEPPATACGDDDDDDDCGGDDDDD